MFISLIEKNTIANTVYKKLLVFGLNKGCCTFATSDFPSENPRTQTRNFPYTNTLWVISKTETELKKIDWTLLLVYIGIHIIIGLIYAYNLYDREWIQDFYFVVPFIYVFLIFDIYHKRFWNNKILLIWGIIGIIQLAVYYNYRDLPEIQAVNGNDLIWLKALPLTIFTSFILNLINKKIYGDNFIVTAFRLDPNRIEPKDGRKLRPADYIFSVSGFMIIIFGTVFTN